MKTKYHCILMILGLYISEFNIAGHIIKGDNVDVWNKVVAFLERNKNQTLEEMEKKAIVIDNRTPTVGASDITEKPTLEEINLPCKEESLDDYDGATIYSMDNKTFNHVSLKRKSDGHLTYFETHVAVKAGDQVRFRLTEKEFLGSDDLFYDIEISRRNFGKNTRLNVGRGPDYSSYTTVQLLLSANVLSSTEFHEFYIKIHDGNLEFGKEGERRPLISYYDARLSLVNFFRFGSWYAQVQYDCPAPVQGLSCNKENYIDRYIKIDEELLPNVTLKRNSTGHLTYFEMHIAVKAESATIELTETKKFGLHYLNHKIILGADDNDHTELAHHYRLVMRRYRTPNILSPTEFRFFYLKIENGFLVFGKEGETSPIITNYDARYSSIKYLHFFRPFGLITVNFPSQLPSYC